MNFKLDPFALIHSSIVDDLGKGINFLGGYYLEESITDNIPRFIITSGPIPLLDFSHFYFEGNPIMHSIIPREYKLFSSSYWAYSIDFL